MKSSNRFWMIAGGMTLFVSLGSAHAQTQRCNTDKLGSAAAEVRLNWARMCGLTRNVGNPPNPKEKEIKVELGGGVVLTDYRESLVGTHADAPNVYSAQSDDYAVNQTYVTNLYGSAGTKETLQDSGPLKGFYLWSRPRKKPLPQYPTFGSVKDSNAGIQVYPHPALADCRLYSDPNGQNPVPTFYPNLYCQAQPACNTQPVTSGPPASITPAAAVPAPLLPATAALCTADGLKAAQAPDRLDWARRCALSQNTKDAFSNYDTGARAANGGNLQEYQEKDASTSGGRGSYWGNLRDYNINDSYLFAGYNNGATSQSIQTCGKQNGYFLWSRVATVKRARPMYPVYGTASDSTAKNFQQLFPSTTKADDCNLYTSKGGTQQANNFYVVGYCMTP